MPIFINISGTIRGNGSIENLIAALSSLVKSQTGANPSVNVASQDFSNQFSILSLRNAKVQSNRYKLK